MGDPADSAHFLASAGPSGAAVGQHRKRRSVTGRVLGVGSIDHQHPAVKARSPADELARGRGRVGEQRQGEASPAAVGERDRIAEVGIGHQRRNRPERLDVMRGIAAPRLVRPQQHRGHERTFGRADWGHGVARNHPRAVRCDLGNAFADVVALGPIDQCPHRGRGFAWVADPGRRKPVADRCLGRIDQFCGREGAADRGAFLPRLDGHLADHLGHEQVELGGSGRRVGTEERRIQAVALGDEANAFARDHRIALQLHRGRGGTGETHHVLKRQMLHQVADPADHQLDRAPGQDVGFDHHPERGFGEPGGRACRLDDRGDPGKQCRGKLLEHSPDREVERVDMERDPLERGEDMLPDEGPGLAQRLHCAVEQHPGIGQFAPTLG